MTKGKARSDHQLSELLLDRYQIKFKNVDLLYSALTHSSFANEHRELAIKDYERLEFLGDAVLELNVSEYIFKKFPQLPEGQLTKLRADIVCTASFSRFCREVGLPQFIRLGNGEEKAGSRNRDTLLEDVFEAFVGALYLDQGNSTVVSFLQKVVYRHIDAGEFSDDNDFKTELQEELQQNGDVQIDYQVIKTEGTDDQMLFTVQLVVNQKPLTTGVGHSKKDAEQKAAHKRLQQLHQK